MRRRFSLLLVLLMAAMASVRTLAEVSWGSDDLIAQATVSCGADASVLSNVGLAADSVYDTTLASGDTFSFNDIVGPRTAECGYVEAVNGRGETVSGGGAAQVASAIWLSIQALPDVSVVQKATYGDAYSQSYVSSSADAILVDYGDGTDFAFRYNGDGCITIYTWLSGETLYCEIHRNA